MRIAEPGRILAGSEIIHALVREPADARVEHADVDELALAGKLLVAHGGEDRDRGVLAGHLIGNRHAYLHGSPLRLAGQAHDATHPPLGQAACRERVWQYIGIPVSGSSLKKTKTLLSMKSQH